MPALPKILRKGVVYLYRTRQEAESHSQFGGTAAIIGKIAEGTELSIPYLISNRHVVFENASSVVRINRLDGSNIDIFETEPDEWFPHPDGDDLVIRPASDFLDTSKHDFGYNPFDKIATLKNVEDEDIDIGDDVFMIGRFVGAQGNRWNEPALRFGNISTLPIKIKHPIYNKSQQSFAIEMRSRSGFSGSPVFIYWTNKNSIIEKKSGKPGFVAMLGINWGFIIDDKGKNTWMNGVVPGWKVRELFDIKQIKEFHSNKTEEMKDALRILALIQ